jgi:hypothetical protein
MMRIGNAIGAEGVTFSWLVFHSHPSVGVSKLV